MYAMISGLFIGSNDGRPPQAYKENIVSLSSEIELQNPILVILTGVLRNVTPNYGS